MLFRVFRGSISSPNPRPPCSKKSSRWTNGGGAGGLGGGAAGRDCDWAAICRGFQTEDGLRARGRRASTGRSEFPMDDARRIRANLRRADGLFSVRRSRLHRRPRTRSPLAANWPSPFDDQPETHAAGRGCRLAERVRDGNPRRRRRSRIACPPHRPSSRPSSIGPSPRSERADLRNE